MVLVMKLINTPIYEFILAYLIVVYKLSPIDDDKNVRIKREVNSILSIFFDIGYFLLYFSFFI